MKISERTKWILTIGILLILIVGAGVYYALQLQDRGKLQEDLDLAQAAFLSSSALKDQRLNDIEAANLDVFNLALVFPTSAETTEIEEALFGAAAEAQVSISTVSCSEARAQTVGSTAYQVYTVATTIRGVPENLLRFLGVLGYWLPTASMDSVGLAMPGQGETTLSLSLQVYTLGA
jgi:hypothetical protein